MGVQWITHQGKQILYTDHRGLDKAQLLANGEKATVIVEQSAGQVLALVNFSGIMAQREILDTTKQWGRRIAPKILKQAVVIDGTLQEALVNLYNTATRQQARAFTSEEAAKDWLVSD